MSLTRQDVDYAYRLILGREPESEENIQFHLQKSGNLAGLRRRMLNSKAFQRSYWELMGKRKQDSAEGWLDLATEKLVFLHIRKNAGTTMARLIDAAFPASEIFPPDQNVENYAAAYLAQHQVFRGHFTLHDIQMIPGSKRIFTLLRAPRARILSHYRYHRALGLGRGEIKDSLVAKAQLPLKAYLRDPFVRQHEFIDNHQTRCLFHVSPQIRERYGIDRHASGRPFETLSRATILEIAKDNLRGLDHVGLVEEFDAFARLLFRQCGLPMPAETKPQNVSAELARSATGAPPQAGFEEPDAEVHALLDELVALDDELYRLGAELYRAQAAATGEAARHAAE